MAEVNWLILSSFLWSANPVNRLLSRESRNYFLRGTRLITHDRQFCSSIEEKRNSKAVSFGSPFEEWQLRQCWKHRWICLRVHVAEGKPEEEETTVEVHHTHEPSNILLSEAGSSKLLALWLGPVGCLQELSGSWEILKICIFQSWIPDWP